MSADDANPFRSLDASRFRSATSTTSSDGTSHEKSSGGKGYPGGAAAHSKGRSASIREIPCQEEEDTDFARAMLGVSQFPQKKGHAGKSGGLSTAGQRRASGLADQPRVPGKLDGAGQKERLRGQTAEDCSGTQREGFVSMAESGVFQAAVRAMGQGEGGTSPRNAPPREENKADGIPSDDAAEGGGTGRKAVGQLGRAVAQRAGVEGDEAATTHNGRSRETFSPVGSAMQPGAESAVPPAEDAAFLQAMQGVKGLTARGRDVQKRLPVQPRKAAQHSPSFQDLLESSVEFLLEYSEEYIQGHVVGFDPLVLGKLRAGQFSPEAHLDLHGMIAQEAYQALVVFIRSAYVKGLRTVLLIPGRGRNSPEGFGVLREKMQHWLTKEPFRRVVLAFCTAQARDGGAGAVYVMLRKFKKSRGKIHWERLPQDPDLFI